MALVEYGGGGRRNFIFTSEEREGKGWGRMEVALREAISKEEVVNHNRGGVLQALPMVGI